VIALHHLTERPDYYVKLEEMMPEPAEEPLIALPDSYANESSLRQILNGQGYELNNISKDNKEMPTTEALAEGGVVVGKRHSEMDENGETGEKFKVEATGQVVELEGGEGVMCGESMESDKEYNFEGKRMTGREIASHLNHKYGGVEFAKGGKVCPCMYKFYHGGELPSAVVDRLKGGEAVVTVKTMESKDRYSFEGKKETPRQILSKINAEHGGKKFEEGGTIDVHDYIIKNNDTLAKMVYFSENILHS
jgi:hypothetical protein